MGLASFGSGSKGNSHLLKIGDTRILLDAGVSLKKFEDFGVTVLEIVKIDAVLITHEHQDHAKYAKELMKHAIDCYMSHGTKEALGLNHLDFRAKTIKAGEKVKIKDLTITAFESFHDAEEPLNFLVSGQGINFVYITDTAKAPYRINNLTHIMIEANYDKNILMQNVENGKINPKLYKRIINSHLSIDGAIKFLKNNDLGKVRKIYLTHLSDANANAREFKNRVAGLTGKETYVL